MNPTRAMVKKIKLELRRQELVITPSLEDFLVQHGTDYPITDEAIARILKLLAGDRNSDRTRWFGASSRGSCKRAQVFAFLGMPKKKSLDTNLQMVFDDGKWRHLRWQVMLLSAGLVDDVEFAAYKRRSRLRVRLDGINHAERFGVEVKGLFNISRLFRSGIPDAHNLQMASCFIAVPDIDRMIYIGEDKQSQEYKEIVVDRDPTWIKLAQRELDELNAAVDRYRLPRVLEECKHGKGPTFNECPFSRHCLTHGEWPKEVDGTPVTLRTPNRTKTPQGPKRRKLPGHR